MFPTQWDDGDPAESEPLPAADGPGAGVPALLAVCDYVLVAVEGLGEVCCTQSR